MFTVSLADGKYEVTNNNGILTVKRKGESWPAADENLIGDGLSLAMMQKIEELSEKLEKAQPITDREEYIQKEDERKPVMKDGVLENFTVTIDGHFYRCSCGCNVYHKPDIRNLDLFKCNGCGEEFEAV